MRLTLAAVSFGVASIVACGTFSGAEDTPSRDAGADAGADAAFACPTVVDGPGACAVDPTIDLGNDPKNCGTCAHSCGSGSCVDARCAPEPMTSEVGFGLALADRALFLAGGDRVLRIDVDAPGKPTVVAQNFLGDLRGLSLGGDTLYLSTTQEQYVLPISGAGGLSSNPGLQGLPKTGLWLAVPDGTAYYLYADGAQSQLAHLSSGPLAKLAEDRTITAVTARATTAFWVVDAGGGGSTLRGPFDAPKDLAKTTVPMGAITDDGDHAYYVDGAAHRVMRVGRDGAGEPIAIEPGAGATAMTMDGDRIVYATVRTEQVVNTFVYVVSVSRCGGSPVVLAKLPKDVTASSLAGAAGAAYVATTSGVTRVK